MASYEQLSAQQRAIVDLIIKRGRRYDELSEKLGMPPDRIRELALDALTSLAPVSAAAVDEGWRAQIADYLLGQQPGPEAASTRGHLRRSEAARAWSRSVLDSLEHLYPDGDLPSIPSGDPGEPDASVAPAPGRGSSRWPMRRGGTGARAPDPDPRGGAGARAPDPAPLSPEAAAIVRRRRIAAVAGAAAVVLLLVLLVWPVGLLGGGDSDADGDTAAAGGETSLVGQVVLRPTKKGADDAGIALVTQTGDRYELGLEAKLTPTKRNQAYEVWLYNAGGDARSLGAQVTDEQGTFAGRAELPENWRDYRFLDISREPVDQDKSHSGTSILRARVADIKPPAADAQQSGTGDGAAGS